MESNIDIRAFLTDYDVSPVPRQYLSTSHPDRSLALFFQDEKKLSKRWKLDLGLRFDKSAYRPDFVSPRAALIYQPSEWTYKFLYGRSFRNPSAFQLFYGDGIADVANPALRPESADTVEVDAERKLGKRMNLQASAYGYRLHDFLVGVYPPGRTAPISEHSRDDSSRGHRTRNQRPSGELAGSDRQLRAAAVARSRRCPGEFAATSGQAAFRGAAGAKIRPQQRHAV